jgi:hypothetical protein
MHIDCFGGGGGLLGKLGSYGGEKDVTGSALHITSGFGISGVESSGFFPALLQNKLI